MSLRLLHANPTTKEGYLKKTASSKGEDVFRGNWKDRYFKLYSNRLDYFKQREDNTPAGSVDLRDALIEAVESSETGGMPFCIRIGEAKQVFVYVAAASALDRDDWLRVLRICAGVEEDLQDTLAAVAAVDLRDRSKNICSWTVLMQDITEMAQPELVSIALGSEGMFRIYKDAKLWRTYDGTQIINVKSSMKAEQGIGVGKHWRMLAEIYVEFKLHPLTSGQPSPGSAKYNFYVGTEEEVEALVPFLKAISKNDLGNIVRLCKKIPQFESSIEVYDLSFRTNWTSKYALLTQQKLLIFNNSNDPSPWRAYFIYSSLDVVKEGMLGLTLTNLLEKEQTTLKFTSEAERNEWYETLQTNIRAAFTVVEQKRVEAERLAAEAEANKKLYKPLTGLGSMDGTTLAARAAAGGSSSYPPKQRLQLSDLNEESAPPPPPSSSTSLFDFELPEAYQQPEWKAGESSFLLSVGTGASGQLGIRNKETQLRPVVVESLKSKPLRAIAAGVTHAAILTEAGHVYMMGSGPLGLGERMIESKAPYLVTSLLSTPIHSVSCGKTHTLALTNQGVAYAWGINDRGQTGLGHRNPQYYPIVIEAFRGKKIHAVSAGNEHSGAIAIADGVTEVYTWGSGANGCLGLGSTENHALPVLNAHLKKHLPSTTKVVKVACGQEFTLLVTSSGQLYACGNNHEGQLGMGDLNKRSLFSEVNFFTSHSLRVFDCAAGNSHSVVLALNANNESAVYTFGSAIANGFREIQPLPIHVPALLHMRHVSSTSSHTITLNHNHRPFAFGLNQFGELGNGEAGVQALVKIRLNSAIQVYNVAAGAGFTLMLCRGEAPPHVLPGPAPEAIPPPPQTTESTEIKQALGIQSGNNEDFSQAVNQISRLLQMEASRDEAQSGIKTQIEKGNIDFLAMQSINTLMGMTSPSLPAPPTASSSSSSSTPAPPPPAAAAALPTPSVAAAPPTTAAALPVAPIAAGSVAPAKPFTFTAAAVAAVPMPSPSQVAAASSSAATPATAAAAPAAPMSIQEKIKLLQSGGVNANAPAGQSPAPFVFTSPTGTTTTVPLYNVPKPAAAPVAATPTVAAAIAASAAAASAPAAAAVPPPPAAEKKEKKEKAPLPPGWKKVKDEASGRSYYYHTVTKETSWKRPKIEEDELPPPPPPPEDE